MIASLSLVRDPTARAGASLVGVDESDGRIAAQSITPMTMPRPVCEVRGPAFIVVGGFESRIGGSSTGPYSVAYSAGLSG